MSDTTLIFKVSENKYQGFHIKSLKVVAFHEFNFAEGEFVLVESGVSHDAFPSDEIKGFLNSTIQDVFTGVGHEKVVPFKMNDLKPMGWIGVRTVIGGVVLNAVVDPILPDLSTAALLVALKVKKLSPSHSTSSSVSRCINPARILAGCMASHSKDVLCVDDVVKTAELKVPSETTNGSELRGFLGSKFSVASTQKTENNVWKTFIKNKPKDNDFYVSNDDWEVLMYCMLNGKNVLLTGPSGCGKSELVWTAIKALNKSDSFAAFNMGAMSEPRTSLIGATHFDDTRGTWFNESRFVRTIMKEGSVVLLDEITRAERGSFNILLPLLDAQGYLALDEAEDAKVIHKAKNVSFVATANVGAEYTGTDELDQALRNRFAAIIDLTFPTLDQEIEILKKRTGVQESDAIKLCSLAKRQRDMSIVEGDFRTQISTRMLLEAAEKIVGGITMENACRYAIVNHFPSDGGENDSERVRIRQIIQKNGS